MASREMRYNWFYLTWCCTALTLPMTSVDNFMMCEAEREREFRSISFDLTREEETILKLGGTHYRDYQPGS